MDELVVTAAALARNFGQWQDKALAGSPVMVSSYGRPRTVLISAENFAAMRDAARPAGGRRTDSRLQTSLSAILENTEQGFIAFDAALQITCMNGVAEAFLGCSRDQLIGAPLEVAVAVPNNLLAERCRRMLKAAQPMTFDVNCCEDEERWLSVRAFPFPGGGACLFTNKTEQQEAISQLQASGAYVAAVNGHPSIGVAQIDSRGVLKHANPALAQLMELKQADLVGARLVDLIHPGDRGALADAFRDLHDRHPAKPLRLRLLAGGVAERLTTASLAVVMRDVLPDGAVMIVNADGEPHGDGQQPRATSN